MTRLQFNPKRRSIYQNRHRGKVTSSKQTRKLKNTRKCHPKRKHPWHINTKEYQNQSLKNHGPIPLYKMQPLHGRNLEQISCLGNYRANSGSYVVHVLKRHSMTTFEERH